MSHQPSKSNETAFRETNPRAVLQDGYFYFREDDVVAFLQAKDAETKKAVEQYQELILAVGKKFEGETRHQTALRYIRQAEQPSPEATQALTPPEVSSKDDSNA